MRSRQVELKLQKKHLGIDKLLLFDLDETLAHCVRTENPEQEPDVQLQIRLQSGGKFKASFNIRPYTHEMLREVNKYYEVAVFTASHKWYADEILNYIDPTGELIQHRFYRESCIKTEDSVYLKDLRIIKNVAMKDMILVDNAVYGFGQQLSNGVPITPFKEDKNDKEFLSLMRFLVRIHKENDLRLALRDAFSFENISCKEKYDFENFIEFYDYEACEQEQEEDDDYEEQQRKQDDQVSAGPPSTLQNRRKENPSPRTPLHANNELNQTLAKSVQDSLDEIAIRMRRSAQ